ncbi:putative pentatricopeptide repeat-containing protein, mitochondrial [Ananas comosus]|uniref:Putative pentatricopeptide repeat-containing protein, mitochondrial n=1 Tax=Ananas comosus TaxID=4615 RepID=A0A199VX19_ANACO|nr:putative pentatricopeptide repeat-containing protein, mitochondrial [Ananas comosus]
MRNVIKPFASHSLFSHHFNSLRTLSSNNKPNPPSLYQNITNIIFSPEDGFPSSDDGSEGVRQIAPKSSRSSNAKRTHVEASDSKDVDRAFGENSYRESHTLNAKDSSQGVRRIGPKSSCSLNAKPTMSETSSEDVSPIVQRITEIVRSETAGIGMERRLDELGLSCGPDVVEMVLKRCFKVGHLALRFFNWVKLKPDYCHTTETYNAMIYIAGEAQEFDLVERLIAEMDDELCPKDIKTWTILISHYGKAGRIGKALLAFEAMRKSGCEPDRGAYKAILRALCYARKPELATEFYQEMASKNMVADVGLYQMLMSCFARSDNKQAVLSLRNDMIKCGQISENEAYSLALKCFCSFGKLKDAQEIFEEMKRKSLVGSDAYEILLKGLCREGKVDEAIEMIEYMKNESAVSSRTYGFLIHGLLSKGDIGKAIDVLHRVREIGCLPTISSYTEIIQHLFSSDQYETACELYEEMLESSIRPDIVVATAMVAGHVRHGQVSKAWCVFEATKEKGLRPTWKSYTVFIKELCKASEPLEAFKLLKAMSDLDINATDGIFGLVINSLTRNGYFEKAEEAEKIRRSFKVDNLESEPISQPVDHLSHEEHEISSCPVARVKEDFSDDDVREVCRILSSSEEWSSTQEQLARRMISFTPNMVDAILRRCQRHSRAALQFFSWIGKQTNYAHTTETYNMAIKLAGSAKDFKHMRYLYQEMKRKGLSAAANTWTIMIAQYGQAGLTELALKTFKEMKSEGYSPDGSTFKYLIVFLCGKKGRKIEEAMKIFQEMNQAGYMPDKETVGIYLSSLCESGKLVDARRTIISLCKRGFETQLAYSMLIKSLCRAGRLEEALLSTSELAELGCRMDQYVYGSIIHAMLRGGRIDEALDKVEEMKMTGVPVTTQVQTSLVVHFCKEKEIEKAVETFKTMRETGCEPTVVTYSALIRGFMNAGMVSDAWDIFWRMKLKGPLPDFETYSMFMTCLCKGGKSEDAPLLIREMLDSGIIPSAVNFRTVFHGLNREGKTELAQSVLQTKWLLKRERMFLN